MIHTIKNIAIVFIMALPGLTLYGQSEFGTYFLEGSWAGREVNVSDSLHGKFEIYLPGIYFESHHSNGIGLSDLIENNGQSSVVDVSNVISQFDPINIFENNSKINSIGFGIKLKHFDLDVRHNVRFNSRLDYPEELIKLIFEGNSQYIGETVDFGPSVDLLSYHEYSVGISKSFGALSLGARAKYLSGIGLIQTARNDASLFTDEDVFQLTFNTDYAIQTSNTLEIDGVSDFTFQNDFAQQFFSPNNGWAFDLGASFQVNESLKLSASILDLGAINWADNTTEYTSNGEFTYEGFDLEEFLLNENEEFEINLDTLEEIFAFQDRDTEVKSTLGTKIYLAGQYQLNEKIQIGALLLLDDSAYQGTTYGVNLQYGLGKNSVIGLNYSHRKDSFTNLGFQFLTRVGPIVVFGNTDNIISVLLNDNFNLNGRIGLGLSF